MLLILDYLGVAVFAATGALAASRRNLDLVAFGFFASVTGIGGGTLRDILLGRLPVFWINDPSYIAVCLAMAVLVWFVGEKLASRLTILLWADAIGMAGFAVMGAAVALSSGVGHVPAILMGVLTATFGGIIRDVIGGEPSVLLKKEIYVTAALAGAAIHVGLTWLGLPLWPSAISGAATAFVIRGGAIRYGWTFPTHTLPPRA
jgi:uncharacterized membrane protein YeiH